MTISTQIDFPSFQKNMRTLFIDLAYQIVDCAMDIAKRIRESTKPFIQIKTAQKRLILPKMSFLKDPFVIQCFTESALPSTPAGRIATVTEMVQAGMLTVKEGRRLMKAPDLENNEKLDNASEERIFQILDKIVETGEYTPPDPFIDFELATLLTVQYINLYLAANLEEEKADLLKDFFNAVQTYKQAALPPPMPAPVPTANAMPTPVSPLVPNTNAPAAA
jgi:hypothetical protein